jgi:hypothetical protein
MKYLKNIATEGTLIEKKTDIKSILPKYRLSVLHEELLVKVTKGVIF